MHQAVAGSAILVCRILYLYVCIPEITLTVKGFRIPDEILFVRFNDSAPKESGSAGPSKLSGMQSRLTRLVVWSVEMTQKTIHFNNPGLLPIPRHDIAGLWIEDMGLRITRYDLQLIQSGDAVTCIDRRPPTDMARAIEFVRSVRELGCKVAIDDFGAGHTSFRNLRSLGADIVKIDGAFIERITENEDDKFFVATLVSLAQRIGLETVAERVSKDTDARILKDLGVDYLQGHLFAAVEDAEAAPAEARVAAG